jgi:succinate dehydrogenase / fumarate reductase cytochrome b subunit
MKYAFYPGCLSQTEQFGCLLSARETLQRLGLELEEMNRSSCCGYQSYRLSSPITWNFLTARNMALAERMGLDILTICNECNLSFKQVRKALSRDPQLKSHVDEALSVEGLEYHAKNETYHFVEVLHDKIGVERISDSVVKPLENLRFATQPGCHLFRPKELNMPDEAEPHKLDALVKALGAETPYYPGKLDCCGSSLYTSDEASTLKVAGKKLRSVKESGLDGIVTICPHCFKMLDASQGGMRAASGDDRLRVPVIHYTQLLGLAMGINTTKLGLQFNMSPVELVYGQ